MMLNLQRILRFHRLAKKYHDNGLKRLFTDEVYYYIKDKKVIQL